MSSKKNKGKNSSISRPSKERWYHTLKDETKHSILAIVFMAIAVVLAFAGFGRAGAAGQSIFKILDMLFGAGFFLVPVAFFLASVSLVSSTRPHFVSSTFVGVTLFLLSSLGAADIMIGEKTGGYVGHYVSRPLFLLFDRWVSLVLLGAIFIISVLIILNTAISINLKKKEGEQKEEAREGQKETLLEKIEEKLGNISEKAIAGIKEATSKKEGSDENEIEAENDKKEKDKEEDFGVKSKKQVHYDFKAPPLNLLEHDKGKPSSGDLKANANIIKRTLQNFGIEVEMGEINVGPSVTQFTLKPAEGIKLSRILALQNDLSLALAAHPLRIEAPIPGKALVGIEVPNSTKTIVGLANLMEEEAFQKSPYPLLFCLGRDVSGRPIYTNLSKMPHLLIAGATGSGKSICIHSLLISLLYRNSPESMRLIMIDPKRVELTVYNKIPHILTPVITEPKKAILSLKWACKEMERRYEVLLKSGVRDIVSYHEKHKGFNSMPYLVIVIDELADLMATYPREMEASIVRLAQMSRAVGIHLIVSTQRPSVEVITGLIKANITSRVALQVASQIDSRTILDMAGAEKLLGSGDLLYLAGDTAKPKRIQGPFVSEKEIKNVADYLSKEYKDVDMEDLGGDNNGIDIIDSAEGEKKIQTSFNINLEEEDVGDDDELYEEAREIIIKAGKASTSYLQRRLKVGYARAARLIDMLEERGVVGPGEGAKPRDVLIKDTSYEE